MASETGLSSSVNKFYEDVLSNVNKEDLKQIDESQNRVSTKLQHSKQSITEFNEKSQETFVKLQREWQAHQKMLHEMRNDLEYITKKLRVMKAKSNN